MTALKPHPETISKFVRLMSRGAETIVLQSINPTGEQERNSTATRRRVDDAKTVEDIINQNADGRNQYFLPGKTVSGWQGPNPPRKDQIESVSILCTDIDFRVGESAEDGRTRVTREMATLVESAILPLPTVEVFSGGGMQYFWFLNAPLSPEEAEARNRWIAAKTGGDHTHNCNRVMRLAGTINWPNEKKIARGRGPVLAELTDYDESRIYSADLFPRMEAPSADAPSPSTSNAVARASKRTLSREGKKIDWANVDPNRFNSINALPEELEPHAKISLLCDGGLDVLASEHEEIGHRNGMGPYGSYSDATHAIAGALNRAIAAGHCTLEDAAGILMSPHLPGNKHVLGQKDKRRAVQRALERAGFDEAIAVVEARTGVHFPDGVNQQNGRPFVSYGNTLAAIHAMEVECSFDTFNDRTSVHGHAIGEVSGEFADHVVTAVRHFIYQKFKFYPNAEHVREALTMLCREHAFNSVVDEFATFTWDGVARLDRLLPDYLGADDTAFNRAAGRKTIIAMVRRARHPGCKFDSMLVLEGEEDIGKSLFCKDLAGNEDRHADARILAETGQKQQELLQGKLVYEIAELADMKRGGVDAVKNFLTTTHDLGRPAYGRIAINRARSCIFIGTTNRNRYLTSTTGNRRFWPVLVKQYDREAFLRDRAQIIAEAAHYEAEGENLYLTADMKALAKEAQRSRLVEDGWAALLSPVMGTVNKRGIAAIFTSTLLSDYLKLPSASLTPSQMERLQAVMHALGWRGPQNVRIGPPTDSKVLKGYWRAPADIPVQTEAEI